MPHADMVKAVGLFRALGGENLGLLLHLLDCSRCRLRLQTALLPPPADDPATVAPVLSRKVMDRVMAQEQAREEELHLDLERAGPLFEELTHLSPETWDSVVDSERRFQTPGVALRLLGAAEEVAPTNPERSERLASVALSVAERMPPPWIETDLAAEVRVRAWCWVAEARRLLGDPARAEEALLSAMRHLGDPLTTAPRALLCRTLGRLRCDQERSDEALSLFARAVALLEDLRDFAAVAEALADQGWLLFDEAAIEAALSAFLGGLSLVDPRLRPRTALKLRHGLAMCYCEVGQPAKAHKVVAGNAEQLRNYLSDPLDQIRLAWIEAEVYERTGDLGRAIHGLEFVLKTLLGLEAHSEASLATLQLARYYVEDHRADALLQVRSFWGQQASPDLVATLVLFVLDEIIQSGSAAFDLLERAVEYLDLARHNPALEFHPRAVPFAEISWDTLDPSLRQRVCEDAKMGGEASSRPAEEIPLHLRRLISWTLEERTEVRIVFN